MRDYYYYYYYHYVRIDGPTVHRELNISNTSHCEQICATQLLCHTEEAADGRIWLVPGLGLGLGQTDKHLESPTNQSDGISQVKEAEPPFHSYYQTLESLSADTQRVKRKKQYQIILRSLVY